MTRYRVTAEDPTWGTPPRSCRDLTRGDVFVAFEEPDFEGDLMAWPDGSHRPGGTLLGYVSSSCVEVVTDEPGEIVAVRRDVIVTGVTAADLRAAVEAINDAPVEGSLSALLATIVESEFALVARVDEAIAAARAGARS